MGISQAQYRDIMFQYEQTRMKNQRLLDERYKELYQKLPELKEIHDSLVELSVDQAKCELLHPAASSMQEYIQKKDQLLARKAAILKENAYPSDYLNPIYSCPDCKDTGFANNKPCHCFSQAKIDALYENSNLADILENENFHTFREEYYDDTTVNPNLSITARENIRRIREICLDYVKHFDTTYDNLLFYGPTGVGKTFITHCIAKELLDTSHTVVYLTSIQLFDILEKNRFQKEDLYTSNEQITYILDCDLLILDDLGTELSNSFTASQLYYFIEERHTKKRSTIISTNLSFSDLRERYSERIFSRFTGYYDFKQIIGNDI
ncbi:MAG: ATP-binding protein, partial [Clostridiaceae bacterium]|nr:ATP-binding protein [Clostridiaceae bacterium]